MGDDSTKAAKRADSDQAGGDVVLLLGGGGREHAVALKLAESPRVRKVLRYEIHLESFDANGKSKAVLNWQDSDFGQTALWWVAMHGNASLAQKLTWGRGSKSLNTPLRDGPVSSPPSSTNFRPSHPFPRLTEILRVHVVEGIMI